MRTKLVAIVCLFITAFFLLSCSENSVNTVGKKVQETFDETSVAEKLEPLVKQSIRDELDKKGLSNDSIISLRIVHKAGNEYKGILKTYYIFREFSNEVEITYDGSNYTFKVMP